MKIGIIYWSGSGNTEKMASLIEKGAYEGGAAVTLKHVSSATPEDIDAFGLIAFGSPAIGDEWIDESEMEPFVSSVAPKLKGKRVALFGSCGWGDGEWLRKWKNALEGAGIGTVGECLAIRETPENEEAEKCIEYGRVLASSG